ncbi:CARDB domain-containing protein [Halosolutus gelatinilyticus]|uniref:CARDB domain-containing protein n=1 Tax=Halosolutus gelatinilyticus TaxID=2931975 RepID=UPI001FF3B7EF|nr:CARDB domain-containing protein [Halosolutus gelatinilyticus]
MIGGATIGGNFWAGPDGNGFGEACTDRGDGICDSAYALDGSHVDHLPLAAPATGDAPAHFAIGIDGANSPVVVGQPLEVTATVQNAGDENATQTIALDLNGTEVDNRSVTLRGGNATTITLGYVPGDADAGSHTATVSSADESASVSIEVTDDSGDDGDDKDDGSGGGTPRPPVNDDDDDDGGDDGNASDGDGDEPDDHDTEDGTGNDPDTDDESNADSDDGTGDGTETGDGTNEETIDDGSDESGDDSGSNADDANGDEIPGFGLLIGIAALLLALAVRVR